MHVERILLVVAHPDDETIGAGAHLKYWSELTIVHLTDGAPRDGTDAAREGFSNWHEYAAERRRELDCALKLGEARHAHRQSFDFADQSLVLRLADVVDVLRGFDAEVVITHAYEGGHPDHDACALACHQAFPQSRRWEFAGYHLSGGTIRTGCFREGPPAQNPPFPFLPSITGEDLQRKQRMTQCYRTQRQTLSQFRPEIEFFRPAPAYDFERAPHDGPLLYETWGFPITGADWRAAARGTLLHAQ